MYDHCNPVDTDEEGHQILFLFLQRARDHADVGQPGARVLKATGRAAGLNINPHVGMQRFIPLGDLAENGCDRAGPSHNQLLFLRGSKRRRAGSQDDGGGDRDNRARHRCPVTDSPHATSSIAAVPGRLVLREKCFEASRHFVGRDGGSAEFFQRAWFDADMDQRRAIGIVEGFAECSIETIQAVAAVTPCIAAGERHVDEIDQRRDRRLTASRIMHAVVEDNMDEVVRRISADRR